MENRDTSNYYGETMLIPNATGGFDEIYETLTQFSLANGRVNLVFRGWDSADNFRERARANSRYERVFNPLITDLSDYSQSIAQLELSALEFMELSADSYALAQLNIDIENLTIDLRAAHLTVAQTVTRTIRDADEFESLKQSNPEILGIVMSFWAFAKGRDSFLRQLKGFE